MPNALTEVLVEITLAAIALPQDISKEQCILKASLSLSGISASCKSATRVLQVNKGSV